MTLLDEILAYKGAADLRARYCAYITDTSVPLDQRWKAFGIAPSDWKEHESFMVTFDTDKEVDWMNDFWFERHEVLDTHDFFSDCLELSGAEKWDQVKVDKFREEVLKKNLGSFKMDW